MRRARTIGVALVAVVLLSGCSMRMYEPVTEQGKDISNLYNILLVAATIVFVLVEGAIVFAVFRYRRRNDDLPNQTQYLIKLEILYTVVPVVIVAVLFAFSYRTQNEVDALTRDPAVTIDVKGFQWQWQFEYRDEDVTVTGLPGQEATMVLPEDRTTRLVLTSPDVIHSFYVPDFLFKRDVIPGVVNRVDVTPRDRGSYVGRCAEFCGLDHAKMTFQVRVVSMADYRTWVAEQQSSATGAAT
jgi:cytochrome c oxidase subunit II